MQKMTKGGRTSNIRRVRRIAFGIPKKKKKKPTFFSIANYEKTAYTSVLWDVYTYVQVLEPSTQNELCLTEVKGMYFAASSAELSESCHAFED